MPRWHQTPRRGGSEDLVNLSLRPRLGRGQSPPNARTLPTSRGPVFGLASLSRLTSLTQSPARALPTRAWPTAGDREPEWGSHLPRPASRSHQRREGVGPRPLDPQGRASSAHSSPKASSPGRPPTLVPQHLALQPSCSLRQALLTRGVLSQSPASAVGAPRLWQDSNQALKSP